MTFDFNFYIILGVSVDASKEEIKKAYRNLSKKYHPDNQETGDEALFKKIGIAYSILSKDERRKLYDLGQWDKLEPENEIELSDAESNVVALFQNAINKLAFGVVGVRFLNTVVDDIRDSLSKEIDNYGDDLVSLKKMITSLNSLLPKVKFESNNTKHNLYKMAITQIISLKEQEIDEIAGQLKLAKEMYGIVQDFYFQDSKNYKDFEEKLLGLDSSMLEIPKGHRSIGRRYEMIKGF